MIYTPVTFRNTAVAPVTAALSKLTLAKSTYGVYINLTSYGNLFWACGMFITETPTDYPSADNVRSGTVYNHGAQNGDMTEPAVGDVRLGVQYGANGTQYTGTLTGGAGGNSCF